MPDQKITDDNPAPTPLTGAEIIPVVQGGTNKRVTVNDVLNKLAVDGINGGTFPTTP